MRSTCKDQCVEYMIVKPLVYRCVEPNLTLNSIREMAGVTLKDDWGGGTVLR